MASADQTPEPSVSASSKPDKPVHIGRFAIGLNVVTQVVIVLLIVGMVNFYSFRHHTRWDLSRSQKFALSSQTKNVLASLEAPMRAIIFFPQAEMLRNDSFLLLREYDFASNGRFKVEVVEPYRNFLRAKELSEKYKFGDRDNIVILDYKGKSKFVNAQDMAEFDQSGAAMGLPPTVKAFKGEEAVTAAILEITEEKQNKLYVLSGHGEPALGSEPITTFQAFVQRQNVKLEPLVLANVDAVPADATGILIFGPKQDLSEREIEQLRTYWTEKKGRLMVLLNNQARTPRLAEFLSRQGVTPQGDRVMKTGMAMTLGEDNQPVMRSGILPAVGTLVAPGKEVTKDLSGAQLQLFGGATSLALNAGLAQAEKIRTISLLEANEGYWGETDYVPGETRQVFFDPQKDHMAPLTLAVALEKGGLSDQRVKVDTARMVIIGNDGFLTEGGLRVADAGLDFGLNCMNWIFNREHVVGIPPKPKEAVQLSMNEGQMNRLALLVLILIPTSVALLGTAVWWQRRA